MKNMISIEYAGAEKAVLHAAGELKSVFSKITEEPVRTGQQASSDGAKTVSLAVDGSLKEQEISIVSDASRAEIRGGSAAALLHAVYTFAEKLGCVFEFSGPLFPPKKTSCDLPVVNIRHLPGIRRRGIRMHLNFVQDQSFFTEKEFREFIDNMARQKFNHLLFHMYTPQQWFPFEYRGVKHLDLGLGNLNRKPLSADMIGRRKVKVKEHWFPREFEHIRDTEELLHAVYGRFKRMMAHAHGLGIRNSVSIEPQAMPPAVAAKLPEWTGKGVEVLDQSDALTANWQQEWSGVKLSEPDIRHPLVIDIAVERVLQCIDAFPDLDEIQLISTEGVTWRPKAGETFAGEISRLCKKFEIPAESFDHESLAKTAQPSDGPEMHIKAHPYWTVPPGDCYYPTVVGSLRYIEFALAIFADERVRKKLAERGVEPEVAVYSPNPETIRLMMIPLAKMLPKGLRFSCLPDYGARDIAANMKVWKPLSDAGHRTGVISWLEFDGMMMLAQGWTDSIIYNVHEAKKLGSELAVFNHWRVRSLEQNAAAAAALCWNPGLSAEEFKEDYFGRMFGPENLAAATEAYALLEEATAPSKNIVYNIGFTVDWVFRHSTDVPGYYWRRLAKAMDAYRKASDAFAKLAEKSIPTGRRQAEYMRDYAAASAFHVEAVYHLQNAKLPLMGYKAWPPSNPNAAWPPPEILKTLAKEASKALALEKKYMRLLAKWAKSCDEQGQLSMHHQGVIEPFTGFAARLAELYKQESTP